jgi:hypothetical protein
MSDTLVIQSHRSPLPHPWLKRCLQTVRDWSESHGFTYSYIGDELFDVIPAELMVKIRSQTVIASDLARLRALQAGLMEGYDTVLWLDADFLIFDPARFVLPDECCAVGREVWVQQDSSGKLRVYKKVHNAFLLFRQGNSLLDFYADTAERLLRQNEGSMPSQFIGPKLLTALHNVANLPVMESAGMLSPLVAKDMIQGQGPALELFINNSPHPVAAANLCSSSIERNELTEAEMDQLLDMLLGS